MTKPTRKSLRRPAETRQRLLDAARGLILERGFTGTGVDEVCRVAGVTKGAFFHHFKSKEELGRTALAEWAAFGRSIYLTAVAAPARYPLEHVHKFFDVMIGIVKTCPGVLTCVVGMMSQELAAANSVLRGCCAEHLSEWTELAREMLAAAKKAQRPRIDFDPEELAWFLNSLWQGSMLVGKTRQTPAMIIRNLEHGRAYVDGLFSGSLEGAAKTSRARKTPTRKK